MTTLSNQELAEIIIVQLPRLLTEQPELNIDHTGITPARVILAVGSINSRHAEALRQAGFEVIEPNLYENEDE